MKNYDSIDLETPVVLPDTYASSNSEIFRTWISSVGFKKYFKNSSWMFFARIIGLVVSFLVTTYVVKYLGPENYGQLSYAVSVTSIFGIFVSLGIDQVLFREIIEHPQDRHTYIGTAFGLKFVSGLVVMLITITTAWLSSGNSLSFWLISLISFSYLFSCWNVIAYEFQADVKSKYPAIASIYVALILNAAKVAVVFFNKGVIYLAVVLACETLLNAIFYIAYHFKYYKSLRLWKINVDVAKKLFSDSWPLLFSSAFAIIYTRIDQVMIKHLINTTSVGLYDAAARLSEAWYFIPALIVSSLFPAIINARKSSEKEYFKRLRSLVYFLVVISILVALPITLFAKEIIFLIYGTKFAGSISILQIYIWAGIGTSLAYVTQNFLLAEKNQKAIFLSSSSAMVVNVVLNIILIPRMGMVGAALATLISYFFSSFSLLFFKNTRHRVLAIFSRNH